MDGLIDFRLDPAPTVVRRHLHPTPGHRPLLLMCAVIALVLGTTVAADVLGFSVAPPATFVAAETWVLL